MRKPRNAKNDCTSNSLPHNRKEVFFDVLKLHFGDLMKCGIILFSFCAPLIALSVYKELALMSFQELINSISSEATLFEEIKRMVIFDNLTALIAIPLFMIASVGFAGIMRIIRQFAWEENVYIRYDFKEGVKQNIRQTILASLIVGLFNFLYTLVQNAVMLTLGGVETYMMIIPKALLAAVFIPALAYTLVSVSLYNNRFFENVRIGFVLYAENIAKTLFVLLLSALSAVLMLVPNFICKIAGEVVFVFALPVCMLGWWLVAYDLLDERINTINHTDLIGRGTFPVEQEEKGE